MRGPLNRGHLKIPMRIPASVKIRIPPEWKAFKKTSFQSTKSGAGEQFVLLDCRLAPKEFLFTDAEITTTVI